MLVDGGHRDIAYISGPLWWGDAKARLAGHKRAMAENEGECDERRMGEGDYHEIGGANGRTQLLQQGIPFSAVACANDEMAAGAMDMVRARGMSIPGDVSIVGFDNAPLGRYLYPRLSTVEYPIADMGRMSARWVLKNIYGQNDLEIQNLFEPKLIARASSGPFAVPGKTGHTSVNNESR